MTPAETDALADLLGGSGLDLITATRAPRRRQPRVVKGGLKKKATPRAALIAQMLLLGDVSG